MGTITLPVKVQSKAVKFYHSYPDSHSLQFVNPTIPVLFPDPRGREYEDKQKQNCNSETDEDEISFTQIISFLLTSSTQTFCDHYFVAVKWKGSERNKILSLRIIRQIILKFMQTSKNNNLKMSIHDDYLELILQNREWVNEKISKDSEFFNNLAKGQNPKFMWVGCSDSRVPANEITGTEPGEIFVHRNIANMVVHTDINLLSVLDYAVKILRVEHVLVVGHYGCGGILTAMSNKNLGLIDNWLRNIKDVYRLHQKELELIKDMEERTCRFVELNVIEQVYNLCKTSTVQEAWNNNHKLEVHGWVYDVRDGLIKDLDVTIGKTEEVPKIYQFDFD